MQNPGRYHVLRWNGTLLESGVACTWQFWLFSTSLVQGPAGHPRDPSGICHMVGCGFLAQFRSPPCYVRDIPRFQGMSKQCPILGQGGFCHSGTKRVWEHISRTFAPHQTMCEQHDLRPRASSLICLSNDGPTYTSPPKRKLYG